MQKEKLKENADTLLVTAFITLLMHYTFRSIVGKLLQSWLLNIFFVQLRASQVGLT